MLRRHFNVPMVISELLLLGAVGLLVCAQTAVAKPKLSVADASATEGGTLAFTVTVKPKSERKVKVAYKTADGTTTGADYSSSSGTLKLKPRKTNAVISVPTTADSAEEIDETISLRLLNPSNAKLGHGQATGTIREDAAASGPTVSVGAPVSVLEGNPGGGSTAVLPVALSRASSRPVSISFSTAGSVDAADLTNPSGSISIPPGETQASLSLGLIHDFVEEPDETGTVSLSNPVNASLGSASAGITIIDDDAGVGDLVFTEVMADPSAVGDAAGEWTELHSVDTAPIDLTGLQLQAGATTCALPGSLPPANTFVVASSADSSQNGGFTANAACPFTLPNTGTLSIQIPTPATVIDTISYPAVTSGRSWTLDPDFLSAVANDTFPGRWCLAQAAYGLGDQGTPGANNEQCP